MALLLVKVSLLMAAAIAARVLLAEYLETLVPLATPVRLESGGQQSVELRLR